MSRRHPRIDPCAARARPPLLHGGALTRAARTTAGRCRLVTTPSSRPARGGCGSEAPWPPRGGKPGHRGRSAATNRGAEQHHEKSHQRCGVGGMHATQAPARAACASEDHTGSEPIFAPAPRSAACQQGADYQGAPLGWAQRRAGLDPAQVREEVQLPPGSVLVHHWTDRRTAMTEDHNLKRCPRCKGTWAPSPAAQAFSLQLDSVCPLCEAEQLLKKQEQQHRAAGLDPAASPFSLRIPLDPT